MSASMFLSGPLSPAQLMSFWRENMVHLSLTRHLTYSTFCLLIWDHLITLDDEIRLVWSSEFTLAKALFTLNRYAVPICLAVDVTNMSGLVPNLSDNYCGVWTVFDVAMEALTLNVTTLVIILRVHAVWGNRRTLLLLLMGLYILHVIGTVSVIGLSAFSRNLHTYRVLKSVNICGGSFKGMFAVWIPVLFLHTTVLLLLLAKAIVTPRNSQTPVLKLLIRDGALYFAVVFSAMFFNMVFWAVARPTLGGLPRFSVWAICTVAVSRLMLNLTSFPTVHWERSDTPSDMERWVMIAQSADSGFVDADREGVVVNLEFGLRDTKAGHLLLNDEDERKWTWNPSMKGDSLKGKWKELPSLPPGIWTFE